MKLVDSSCIICLFSEIERPNVLLDWIKYGYQIVITQHVYDELQNNVETKNKATPHIKNGNIIIQNTLSHDEITHLSKRFPYLGFGELSVIQTALSLNRQDKRYYAVLDDGRARKVALKLGVNLTGTYGLLKTLKEKGYISEEQFNIYKTEMNNSSFRINFDRVI